MGFNGRLQLIDLRKQVDELADTLYLQKFKSYWL